MRKRWLTALVCVILLSGILTACGSSSGSAGSGGTDAESKSSGKLTIYSPNAAEINNPIIKEFQDRTGISVDLISGGTGELLKRVEAEANNPLGDIFWAGGADSLASFAEYFEPYSTSEKSSIFPGYLDPANNWTPFNALPMVITYNKELVPEDEVPQSWEDLLDPKWKGQIAFADPAKSGSSYTQLVTMLTAFGKDDEQGWEYVKQLVDNMDGKILSGSSLVQRAVPDGEFALGITLEDAALRYMEGGAQIGIIYPSEGTSAVPDGAAIIKGTKNLEEAKQFMDFLVGKDVQELVQSEFKRRSVRDDVNPVEGLPQTVDIELVEYDFEWASDNKEAIIERFTNIMMGIE
ncbi:MULTISPECIES: ABC transporter substrate-binding protein [Paenibacillus]|uniref:Extracellular solute-binding protein n=1 Tax=Paenibacillus campinasensis TaxID=66347 RepID=A0A268EV13_9BACL|nr:ABC transporter substrate-binding protein [Paenibacillus campinasensis]MUG67623.1 extracellular solute-binding protein [Paenibacillus campinasensis]PAD76958.1 iron ABC transporter substrate-binding protein [Paenibacillus campinasensis]